MKTDMEVFFTRDVRYIGITIGISQYKSLFNTSTSVQ